MPKIPFSFWIKQVRSSKFKLNVKGDSRHSWLIPQNIPVNEQIISLVLTLADGAQLIKRYFSNSNIQACSWYKYITYMISEWNKIYLCLFLQPLTQFVQYSTQHEQWRFYLLLCHTPGSEVENKEDLISQVYAGYFTAWQMMTMGVNVGGREQNFYLSLIMS